MRAMAQISFGDPASIGEGEIRVLAEGPLLIRHQGKLHCIDNKCGHFGVPMADGVLQDGTIACRQHGISFSLVSGEVINRPWENCDGLRIHTVVESDHEALIELRD
jgi:nitrite reductase/ring-hydroxylating ferredoxin subunit